MIKLLSVKIISEFEVKFEVKSEVGEEEFICSPAGDDTYVYMGVTDTKLYNNPFGTDSATKISGVFKGQLFQYHHNVVSSKLVFSKGSNKLKELILGNLSVVIKFEDPFLVSEVVICDGEVSYTLNNSVSEWNNHQKIEETSAHSFAFDVKEDIKEFTLSYYGYTGYVTSSKDFSGIKIHYQNKPLAKLEGILRDTLFYVDNQSILALDEFPVDYILIPFESMGGGFGGNDSDIAVFKSIFMTIVNGIIAYKIRFPHVINRDSGTLYQDVAVL